jgi:hypothetical protein
VSTKIYTCKWGVNVFHNGIHAYRKRAILWKLWETERRGVKYRGSNINSNDGDSVYRVCVTMRANVVMGGDGDNESDISDTVYRGGYSAMGMRGI